MLRRPSTIWIVGVVLLALMVRTGARRRAAETPAPTEHDGRFYLGGVQVHEPDSDRWVDSLKQIGMNSVEVTVYARQGDWDGDDLRFDPPDPGIVEEIRAAKRGGLSVVLVLRVAVDHAQPRNRYLWHGMILPATEPALRSWFVKYTRFAEQWARIAEREGVDVFGIGSEMNALNATRPVGWLAHQKSYYSARWYHRLFRDRARRFAERIEPRHLRKMGYGDHANVETFLDDRLRRTNAWIDRVHLRSEKRALSRINRRRDLTNRRWTELIRRVRTVYSGQVTYAANFDSYRDVGFWPELDLIGINAYFPLRDDLDRELDETQKLALFARRWEEVFRGIEGFQRERKLRDRPVLFTEIGYTNRRHTTVEPWTQGGFSVIGWSRSERRLVIWEDQPVDYDERRLALEALAQTHRKSPVRLIGVLYWKLSTDRAHEAIEPFMLHVGPDSTDPSQPALLDFVRPDAILAGAQ